MSELKTIIDANIKENGNQEITGKTLNYVLNEIANEVYQSGNFNEDGKYPNLVAGDLYGHGESVPAEFSFRATGGKSIKDGVAYIKELQGNAVVWNQSCKPFSEAIRFPHDSVILTEQGVSLTNWDAYQPFALPANLLAKKGHKCLLMFSYTNTTPSPQFAVEVAETAETRFTFTQSSESVAIFLNVAQSSITDNINVFPYVNQTGECTISNIRFCDLTLMYGAGNEPTTIEEYYARKPIVADEYAYNEGEVIPFRAEGIKSIGDNAWDEQWEKGIFDTTTGEKLPNADSTSIRSKNPIRVLPNETYYIYAGGTYVRIHTYDAEMNQINTFLVGGETYGKTFTTPTNCAYVNFRTITAYGTTYKNDIMIRLDHSGWKTEVLPDYQPYWEDTLLLDSRIKEAFPNGMYRAGSAYDEIRYNKDTNNWEAVQRIKGVKMKDLNWSLYTASNNNTSFMASLQDIKQPSTNAERIDGALIAKYYPTTGNPNTGSLVDKCWVRVTNVIYIKDDAFVSAEAFANSLNDNDVLYYELAEPIVTPLGKFEMDYMVADFGTEEIIGTLPSAPFNGRTIYQFNAVDQIRENYNEIEKIKAALAKAGITLDL